MGGRKELCLSRIGLSGYGAIREKARRRPARRQYLLSEFFFFTPVVFSLLFVFIAFLVGFLDGAWIPYLSEAKCSSRDHVSFARHLFSPPALRFCEVPLFVRYNFRV